MSNKSKIPGGVTEFQYRKAMESIKKKEQLSSFTVDAAALQADMAKRFNLSGSKTSIVRQQQQTQALAISRSSSAHNERKCDCCRSVNAVSHDICRNCGYYLSGVPDIQESLAQRRGLVPAPVKVVTLSQSEWNAIEHNIRERSDPDSCCPICMEGFNQGHEVLLSCSHIFHRNCLQSFEKFMKNGQLTCPICRMTNYQKKITHIGTHYYQIACVKRLQALWRGYNARKYYRTQLRSFYRTGRGEESQRKKYYESEVTSLAKRISQNVEDRSEQVDTMISSMDRTLSDGKQLDVLFEQMIYQRMQQASANNNSSSSGGKIDGNGDYSEQFSVDRHYNSRYYDEKHSEGNVLTACRSISRVDWPDVIVTARSRGQADCAICMFSCFNTAATATAHHSVAHNKKNVILSCSHVFHEHCIGNFEKFLRDATPTCPVCRSEYEKRDFDQLNSQFLA